MSDGLGYLKSHGAIWSYPRVSKHIYSDTGILAHRTSEDDGLGCTITETKRKVFRFHYHSQKVIGSVGHHWFLDIFDGCSGTKNEFGIEPCLFQFVFLLKMMTDMWIDLIYNCCLKESAWILHVWNSHLHLPYI